MSNSAPKIAIICGQDVDSNPAKARIHETSENYTAALTKQGALPFLIPIDFPLTSLDLIFKLFDGVMLIGGDDVAIDRFNGKPHESISAPNYLRDEIEIQVVQEAARRDFPLMGICRGEQVINVAMGGDLITDIPSQWENPLTHRYHPEPGQPETLHKVGLVPGTKVQSIYGSQALEVNSYHHQAVGKIAAGFRAAAYSDDGIIEAIESENHSFLIGTQWHPERMQQDPLQQRLFKSFVDACRRKK